MINPIVFYIFALALGIGLTLWAIHYSKKQK